MTREQQQNIPELVDAIYRTESRRILATLIRLLGDMDTAEEALQDAFRAALEQWPGSGVPDNPRAWLVSAGKFKAIDSMRRQSRFQVLDEEEHSEATSVPPVEWEAGEVEDDQLRLIFTCCHPALASEARLALTLREVCSFNSGTTHCPRQGENPGSQNSIPGAVCS